MELRLYGNSNLIKNSAGFVVFTLINHIQELSSELISNRSASLQDEFNDFIIHYPQNSVLSIFNSLIKSTNINNLLSYEDTSTIIKITKKVIDEYFALSDYADTLTNLNKIIIFQLENFDNIIQVLELIDSKLKTKKFNYSLKAIIVKKNNMFGIITNGISGLVYYKMTSCENFRTWGEALFSAYEGDFLPNLLTFVRNDGKVNEDLLEFVTDFTMVSLKNMQQISKQCIKSTHRYEICDRVLRNVENKDENLVPNEENALKVLESLKDS